MNTAAKITLPPLQQRWATLAPRERIALSTAAWVVGAGLMWSVALSPALQTLRAAGVQRIELDRQLQLMQGLQNEAQALKAQPKLTSTEALKALEASAKQRLGQAAQVNAVGERVTVTLKGASPDALAQWLAQARANAHALPVEAKLARSAAAPTAGNIPNNPPATTAPGWDGSLVLRLP
jgi:general secretion pathway protein M